MITKSYWEAVQVNVELKLVNFKKSVHFVWKNEFSLKNDGSYLTFRKIN